MAPLLPRRQLSRFRKDPGLELFRDAQEQKKQLAEYLNVAIEKALSNFDKKIEDKVSEAYKNIAPRIAEIISDSISEDMKGEPGRPGRNGLDATPPQAGVDYPTHSQINKYVADVVSVVAKNKLKPPKLPNFFPIINESIKCYFAEQKNTDGGLFDLKKVKQEIKSALTSPEVFSAIARGFENLEEKDKLDYRTGLRNKPNVTGKSRILMKGGGGGSSGGSAVMSYDISSLLNGVTKTFTIPTNSRVISVTASSFPFSFRPTVDYTYTSSSITFTSEIEASSTLATGQTVIVVYSE